jgi:hypothetical protein
MYSYDRTARSAPFGEDQVEKMRKDVLLLMRNVDKIVLEHDSSYDTIQKDYDTLRAGVRTWLAQFDERLYKDFIPHIGDSIRVWLTGSMDYPAEYFLDKERSWYDHWYKKLRSETWGLHAALSDMPSIRDWSYKKKPWAERVKREARKAWAILTEFLKWLGSKAVVPQTEERAVEKTRLEGFTVTIVGYENDDRHGDYYDKSLDIFKEGLKRYRSRAGAVAPVLLSKQLPLVFRYDCRMDLGGEYLRDHIDICASAQNTPDGTVKTLAHEMGHHLFKFLSSAQEHYWEIALHRDLGDLDLRDVLKVWHDGENVWDLIERLAMEDPVLSLQLQGVVTGYSSHQMKPTWRKPDELREYLDAGGNQTWTVPKHPITAYASKTAEEAFCDTIGLAVAYGPMTLDPLIRSWFETIMPGQVKFASVSASAGVLLEGDPGSYAYGGRGSSSR